LCVLYAKQQDLQFAFKRVLAIYDAIYVKSDT